jgi:hypothetical protein
MRPDATAIGEEAPGISRGLFPVVAGAGAACGVRGDAGGRW